MPTHSKSGKRAVEADLARMANQIADNYAHHEFSVAAADVAHHIRLFWTPAMRDDLAEMAAAGRGDLQPLVLEAVALLAAG